MTRILVVEDEEKIARFVELELKHEGYEVDKAPDGRAGVELALSRDYDLVLLDILLPQINGMEVLRRIRRERMTPVIMLTARDAVMDKVAGIDAGADDYLVKPFSPREAVARARAILRRCRPDAGGPATEVARFAGWTVDFRSFQLFAPDGTEVEVTASEVRLLHSFLTLPRRVLTREALMDAEADAGAGGGAYDRSIDVRISRLRQKLGEDPRNPKLIKTVYGSGYMFTAAIDWLPAAVP